MRELFDMIATPEEWRELRDLLLGFLGGCLFLGCIWIFCYWMSGGAR